MFLKKSLQQKCPLHNIYINLEIVLKLVFLRLWKPSFVFKIPSFTERKDFGKVLVKNQDFRPIRN